MDEFTLQHLADALGEHRGRLTALIAKRMNPILLKRLSHEDVLSETFAAAAKRLGYFAAHDDVPVYYKLRTILMQTLTDIERRNLGAAGRDAYKEIPIRNAETVTEGEAFVGDIEDDITSPVSHVDRDERHTLLRSALDSMPENVRAILVMRHFDGMGNSECAAALGISEKAASIRYVRALEKLQKKLLELSCFRESGNDG